MSANGRFRPFVKRGGPPAETSAEKAKRAEEQERVSEAPMPATDTTDRDALTLQAGGRSWTFPTAKTASVGGHRFCHVALEDPQGNLPRCAAVLRWQGGRWLLENVCTRYLV